MRSGTTVWVGRVKSTVAPSLLQDAFDKVGKVMKVETGFAGFAFVEFDSEEDADKACKSMNKVVIPHVGEIRVAKATFRGYEDAVAKRDDYWRSRGGASHLALERDDRTDRTRRSHSRTRQNDSRSRSRPRERFRSKSKSPSKSASRSKSRSASRSTRSSPAYNSTGGDGPRRRSVSAHDDSQKQVDGASRSGRAQDDSAKREARSRDRSGSNAIVPYDSRGEPVMEEPEFVGAELNSADRAAVVCFFDGTSAPELLLEGAAVLRVPDFFVPNILNGLPHGFRGISQEGAMMLLKVLTGFSSCSSHPSEGSVEVRQALVVDPNGRRLIRKSIVIDGTIYSSEERAI